MFPQHVLGAGAALAGLPAALLLLLSAWDGIAGVAALSNAACYDSAGGARPGYYPCDATAFITNCCQQGWTCFSNALCVVTTETLSQPNLTLGQVQRGMCTNPQWNNQICGDRCLSESRRPPDRVPRPGPPCPRMLTGPGRCQTATTSTASSSTAATTSSAARATGTPACAPATPTARPSSSTTARPRPSSA